MGIASFHCPNPAQVVTFLVVVFIADWQQTISFIITHATDSWYALLMFTIVCMLCVSCRLRCQLISATTNQLSRHHGIELWKAVEETAWSCFIYSAGTHNSVS